MCTFVCVKWICEQSGRVRTFLITSFFQFSDDEKIVTKADTPLTFASIGTATYNEILAIWVTSEVEWVPLDQIIPGMHQNSQKSSRIKVRTRSDFFSSVFWILLKCNTHHLRAFYFDMFTFLSTNSFKNVCLFIVVFFCIYSIY